MHWLFETSYFLPVRKQLDQFSTSVSDSLSLCADGYTHTHTHTHNIFSSHRKPYSVSDHVLFWKNILKDNFEQRHSYRNMLKPTDITWVLERDIFINNIDLVLLKLSLAKGKISLFSSHLYKLVKTRRTVRIKTMAYLFISLNNYFNNF